MKLVELLAKELSEWPDNAKWMTQDPGDSCVTVWHRAKPKFRSGEWTLGRPLDDREDYSYALNNLDEASDYKTSVVGLSLWQAERDRQNGSEWKRHRGNGKQPKELGDFPFEVKHRDGNIWPVKGIGESCWRWTHDGSNDDIMAFRVISQPQAEEPMKAKFDGVKLEFSRDGVNFSEIGTARIDNICDLGPAEPQWQQSTGPLAWRDTIIHCQAIIEDCEREIERNVQLLDSEGLFMQLEPKKGMQAYDVPAVDMGDWRNWEVGDIVSIKDDVDVDDGEYSILEIEHSEYEGDMPIKTEDGWPDMDCAKIEFVRRP